MILIENNEVILETMHFLTIYLYLDTKTFSQLMQILESYIFSI